jgi:Ca-activated chloride channel homolog
LERFKEILIESLPTSFANPALLGLLVIPILLGFWEWTRRGHPLILPFDYGGDASGHWLRRFVSVANLCPYVLLALVILLLAGPRKLAMPESERIVTNTQFCLDVSGSMGTPFGESTRYVGAMNAINEFIHYEGRKGDAFGLTIFGNEVLHWVPVTKDLSAIENATPFLEPGKLPSVFGGTSIGRALLACRHQLIKQPEGDRMIILVSDGASSDLSGGRDREIAEDLAADGVVVYVISVDEAQVNQSMYVIAGTTGGEVFQAGDPTGLESIFQRIDGMRLAKLKEGTPFPMDFFTPIAFLGLIVLLLQILALWGIRYTPW